MTLHQSIRHFEPKAAIRGDNEGESRTVLLASLEGQGHVAIDTAPERFVDEVLSFIGESGNGSTVYRTY